MKDSDVEKVSKNDKRRRFSKDAVQSARKFALLKVAIGLLGLQLGWNENHRKQRIELLTYLEKILIVTQDIIKGIGEAKIHNTSITADSAPFIVMTPESQGTDSALSLLMRVMRADNSVFSSVYLPNRSEALMTRLDPGGRCSVRLFQGGGKGRFLVEYFDSLNREQRVSTVQMAYCNQSYPILFGRACIYLMEDAAPSLIVKIHTDESKPKWIIILPPVISIKANLPAAGIKRNKEDFMFIHGESYTKNELNNFEDIATPIVTGYTVDVIGAYVREEATKESGLPFAPENWESALEQLIRAKDDKPSVLGISLQINLAVLFMPLVLLALSFSLLHRLRRMSLDIETDSWILLEPSGLSEWAAFIIWLLLLAFVPPLFFWMSTVYDPTGLTDLTNNLENIFGTIQISDFTYPDGLRTKIGSFKLIAQLSFTWSFLTLVIASYIILASILKILILNQLIKEPHCKINKAVSVKLGSIFLYISSLKKGVNTRLTKRSSRRDKLRDWALILTN